MRQPSNERGRRGWRCLATRFHRAWIAATVLIAGACAAVAPLAPRARYDLVIRNGRVIDPESGLDAVREVGIRAGRIAAISMSPLDGAQTIDATGLVVSPAFIDLHSHSVMTLAGARMQALDGVTSAFELENGVLPVAKTFELVAAEGRPIHFGFSVSWIFARALAVSGTPVEAFSPDDWEGVYSRTDSLLVVELHQWSEHPECELSRGPNLGAGSARVELDTVERAHASPRAPARSCSVRAVD